MNIPAIHIERLTAGDSGFLLPENARWQFLFDIKERLMKRRAMAETAKQERARLSQLNSRLIEASDFVFYG